MIRQRGWALVGVGSLLLALMTPIIVSMALVIARSGDPGAATRFDGSPAMAPTIFAVLGLVWPPLPEAQPVPGEDHHRALLCGVCDWLVDAGD
ncbi:MAG: hypothetical protein IPM24_12875 [Bryobacterales bacterium]|nr:hypothetical protein [Bryobacterales bacterium]